MEEKIGFFKRIKLSIVSFDAYKIFAKQKISISIKYFFQLLLVFSLLATIAIIYPLISAINEGISYMKNEMPNITFQDNKLTLESDEPVKIENAGLFGIIVIDTDINEEEEEQNYLNEMNQYDNSILFLQDKVIVKPNASTGYITYEYNTISNSLGISSFTKQDITNYLEKTGLTQISISVYLIMFFYVLMTYLLVTLVDVVMLSLLAYLTCKIYKVNIPYKGCFSIAIHGLTLPILLNIIYIFINTFTGFEIEYFQVMYNIISYIYILVAVILAKSDFDKNAMDLIKVEGEVEKTPEQEEQIEEPKEEEKEQKEKKDDKEQEKDKKTKGQTPEPGQA